MVVQIIQANILMLLLIPLCGSALAFIVGRVVSKRIGAAFATIASAAAFGYTIMLLQKLVPGVLIEDNLYKWFEVGGVTVDFNLRFDQLSALMCLIITGVGTLIHIYSLAYMAEDDGIHRFFSYLNLFLAAMLTLVLGGNLLILFIGWEGVGLCSYLLIGFWYKDLINAKAGRKAFVVNRIGDAAFLVAVFAAIQAIGTTDFMVMKSMMGGLAPEVMLLMTAGLFIGATGKSAQIPLFIWLPDAMAGPTPVSALIHAATMVTAGVYLLCRTFFLFQAVPEMLAIITVVALLTALIAGLIAIAQNDIKKVLAYSTVSQLGFMFLAIGSGAYWVAIFHVMTHAFFKACLFLSAGSVIHGCHHEQDMRHMGGLARKMPLTFATYFVSSLALAGVAPLSGYYSKHAILSALSNSPYLSWAYYAAGAASAVALVTSFYMARSVAMTFFGAYRGHAHPHESPPAMTIPLIILAGLATISGFWGDHIFAFLSVYLPREPAFHHESLGSAFQHSLLGFGVFLVGLIVFTVAHNFVSHIARILYIPKYLFENKFFIDEFYAAVICKPLEAFSNSLYTVFDRVFVDGTVNSVGNIVQAKGEILRRGQTGQVLDYAMVMFVGALLVVTLYMVF